MRSSPTLLIAVLTAGLLTGCKESPLPPPANSNAESTSFPGTTPPPSIPTPTSSQATPDTAVSSNQDSPALPPTDPSNTEFAGLIGPVPVTWTWEPPRHHFRVAQWIVPGRDGAEPAELVVTTFPEASGNTVQNNIDRWARQFRSTDGSPSQPDIDTQTINDLPVTIVDLKGEYLGMGGGWHKADYRMLVSIVETPDGSVFIKLLGPAETVTANADGYHNLMHNLRTSD
ncbi:MAG: hypothetical protein VX527_01480 [Planctomycetota bacterium]|nr:hypothetical protein [Planctomycetota bacterium]